MIGHTDRAEPLKDYWIGLMLPVKRKSVEPLAPATATALVSVKHQSLLHVVGQTACSDATLLGRVREQDNCQVEVGVAAIDMAASRHSKPLTWNRPRNTAIARGRVSGFAQSGFKEVAHRAP